MICAVISEDRFECFWQAERRNQWNQWWIVDFDGRILRGDVLYMLMNQIGRTDSISGRYERHRDNPVHSAFTKSWLVCERNWSSTKALGTSVNPFNICRAFSPSPPNHDHKKLAKPLPVYAQSAPLPLHTWHVDMANAKHAQTLICKFI